MIAAARVISCKELRFTMCSPSVVRIKLCVTAVTDTNGFIYSIVMNSLDLRLMVHDRGLGNPVMDMLRFAPAIAVRATTPAI